VQTSDGDVCILIQAQYVLECGQSLAQRSGRAWIELCEELDRVPKSLTADAKPVVVAGLGIRTESVRGSPEGAETSFDQLRGDVTRR
jgi:hypothetical protein